MSDRTPVLLRFAPDLLVRVDRARGAQKRTPFLINLIETQLQRQTSPPEDKRGADAPHAGAADSSKGIESLGPVRHTEEVGTGASSTPSQLGSDGASDGSAQFTPGGAEASESVARSSSSSPEQGQVVPVGRDEDGAEERTANADHGPSSDVGADRDSESAPDLDWWEA